uniref:uncharacterized protein LOC122582981 n=1 Tax=Erigeron canadensis TaxID=72917 RepID=UPI001CB8A9B1|nr:uncharacterized protein LOC122582981 [Erigeron canadensis]
MDNNNNNNNWQINKCSASTWHPSTDPSPPDSGPHPPFDSSSRSSMVGSSHYSYPRIVQEPSSSTRKMMADPLFQSTSFNLYNSNLSATGAPFFTLLSVPPSFSQYDSQQVLSSKATSKTHIYNSNFIVGNNKHEASFVSPKPSSQNIDICNLKSKVDIRPIVPVRTLASNGGNAASCLNDVVQARKANGPNVELAKAANHLTSHGLQQSNGFRPLKSAVVSSPMPPTQRGKLHRPSVSHQLSPHASGLSRVFCLYASGDLFLSNSGLLGVVCSCHGFRMSVSQFSEHSGLRDVNPGDAVHMDSGETIAQWRKVYFTKFGIKIPEDHHGWHWPEGLSTAADPVKSSERVPKPMRSSNLSSSVGPPKPIAASTPLNNMVFPNDHHSSQSLVNETNTRVSSNIELRLGQPSHQNQTLGMLQVPTSNTSVSRVSHLMEVISMQPQINNGNNRIIERSKQVVNCAAQAVKSGSTEGKNLLGLSNLGFGAFSTRMAIQPEQLKNDEVSGSDNSMLFSKSDSSKVKKQTKDSHSVANNHHVMPKQHDAESRISKLGLMNFGCNTDNSSKVNRSSINMESYKLVEREKGVEHANHGFSRPVTMRPVTPRPPLTTGSPSIVYTSMVMNSSPSITSTMSKEKATSVLNLHTSSSRQAVHFLYQDSVSFSHGFDKDQNILGNPLNESLRSSNNLPSLLTETRDEYGVHLPELATKKSVHSATTWNAGSGEKSAVFSVTQETPFQTWKSGVQSNLLCDPYQTGPPLSRIHRIEDFGSSSTHGTCCHGTSCTYVPDKCSCWVQKNSMIKNSTLEVKKFLSAFGEPSQIRASTLSASNLDNSCTLHDRSISVGQNEEKVKPRLKKVEFNAFQWKDVPSKLSGRCHVPCGGNLTGKVPEERVDVNDQTSHVAPKCFDQPTMKVDCMKEQVMSNISSKCSAPALTQASVKNSNGDSWTDDAQDTDCAKNFAIDEGSGTRKSWSPDDAHASDSNSGFDGFAYKINSKNETRSGVVSERPIRSLVDELRVIDSLRPKKVQNQLHTGLPENTGLNKTIDKDSTVRKRKRETKFKMLSKSFPASAVSSVSTGNSGLFFSMEDIDKLDECTKEFPCKTPRRVYDDCLKIPESSREKKVTLNLEFSKTKDVWKQELPCRRFTRPIVSGRYGVISNGDTSKPAKIFPLKNILKTAKRCPPAGKKAVKKPPVKTLQKSVIRVGNRRSGRHSTVKKNKYQIPQKAVVFSDDDPMESSDSDLGTRTRHMSKEIRKRSIHELITKGNDSGFATISKNMASIHQDNLTNCGASNDLQEVDHVSRYPKVLSCKSNSDVNTFCNVCGSFDDDEMNYLLECSRCLIKVHQACYGIARAPKSFWYCRPCRENATNMVCVLCGYEGGVMTRALHSSNIVGSLLTTWNVVAESQEYPIDAPRKTSFEQIKASSVADSMVKNSPYPINESVMLNSVTLGVFDSTVKQWVHMVCGLWTPGTRCPNVDTMNAFDVSGAFCPKGNVVCSMCKRPGGCCIKCRVIDCAIYFHPWCAHQKGLLQSEVEGSENEKVGFYGRCELHATEDHCHSKTIYQCKQVASLHKKETCARTEVYKGRKREGLRHDSQQDSSGAGGCLVRQEQVDAWNHIINRQRLFKKQLQRIPLLVQDVEYDVRKEYARYKQSKGWKHLVVYKSGIHALGLYTSLFISQSTMVVEYVGEIVGLRVADRREKEYQSGKQLQYKSACYFFRIDKEHIIDATRKGGIARFVNHSCQPNCVAKVITVRGEKKVVFFAERDIYPGEEITYDYHFSNEDEGKKILCSCNSNTCRHYLN